MYLHKVRFDNVIGSNHGVNECFMNVDEIDTDSKTVEISETWYGYEVNVPLEKIDREAASKTAIRELYRYIDGR